MSNLGPFLAALRESKGWSQRELAAKSDVSYTTIQNIERGATKSPGIDVILALSKTLNVHPMRFVYAHEGKEPDSWRPGTSLPHDQLDRLWEAMADIYPPDYLGKKIDEALRRKGHE